MTRQTDIASKLGVETDYTLEFRTWNGSAYVWTAYADRIVDFTSIGMQIENRAVPNAFKMTTGTVTVNNEDGIFSSIEVMDGVLYNASEPYGESIYKRIARIKENGTVIGTFIVEDIKLNSDTPQLATLETISLDLRASDQAADGKTAERHPLGSTSRSSPSNWTTTQPAGATDNVNMYRWRMEETVDGSVTFGWFKDRHYADIIERTGWALDDLGFDITKTFRLMTADGREIATTRNIPPDDPSVSTGVTPDRCRALVWNPARNNAEGNPGILVCCVGHKVYDYDPTTNTYTLRITLTSGRDVFRAFYTTEADTNGKNKRIVLVCMDDASYGPSVRTNSAYVITLDATGSGSYTQLSSVTVNNVYSGLWDTREGDGFVGASRVGNTAAENFFVPFRQSVDDSVGASGGAETLFHEFDNNTPPPTSLFSNAANASPQKLPPQTYGRGWGSYNYGGTKTDIGLHYSRGQMMAASLNIYHAGGRLYLIGYSGGSYVLKHVELFTYTVGGDLALTTSTHQPYFLYSPQDSTNKKRLYCCQMFWDEGTAGTLYSKCWLKWYDLSTTTWSGADFLSGATGSNQAWMITEMVDAVGVTPFAIMYNRETLKWRLISDIPTSWANTDSASFSSFLNGAKDQDNRLEGLFVREVTGDIYFVEAGANYLWYWDSGTSSLKMGNKTPAGATAGQPINSDRGLGSYIVSTGANYPDSSTPDGVLFWISANDYLDVGADHPTGRYVLCQYANYDPGFIDLCDFSGMSFWDIRNEIAEKYGFVHYYALDGTLVFKPRITSGAASFAFSIANNNYSRAAIQTQGWKAVINDITVKPFGITVKERLSDIVKGYNEVTASKDGMLVDVSVSSNPGETSQWRIVFTTKTTGAIYKLSGSGASVSTPQLTQANITTTALNNGAIPNGAYLSITPDMWEGVFVAGDTFTFWVFEPDEMLEELSAAYYVTGFNATSVKKYRRRQRSYTNRFIRPQDAPDFLNNLMTWLAVAHPVVELDAVADPAYLPLLRATLTDSGIGFDAATFQIMGLTTNKRELTKLILVKT